MKLRHRASFLLVITLIILTSSGGGALHQYQQQLHSGGGNAPVAPYVLRNTNGPLQYQLPTRSVYTRQAAGGSPNLVASRPSIYNDNSRYGTGLPSNQQNGLYQKSRRTHYGQTLSRFFDPVPIYAQQQTPPVQKDADGRVKMGVANSQCDDGKSNLTTDWDQSPINHTCYHPETRFPLNPSLSPIFHCDRLPPRYVPGHVCMNKKIYYSESVPTHGDHRPLWPMFGEYIFVPRERWLHNIEHGAIVMLYHPCAHPAEVNKLKKLVKGCVGKHIITPSTLLSPERPLALVAWSCRLVMASVNEDMVTEFILQKAHKGPEGVYRKEGQYTFGLLQKATMVGNGKIFGYSRVQCGVE